VGEVDFESSAALVRGVDLVTGGADDMRCDLCEGTGVDRFS
jgi:hypothetical protein